MKSNPFEFHAPRGCTDERSGRLLAAYDWGLLSAQEEENLEHHIIGCPACAKELTAMFDIGAALRAPRPHRVGWKQVGAVAAAAALILTVGLGMLDRYEETIDPLIGDSLDIQSGQSMATFSYELTTETEEGFSFDLDIP